MDFHFFYFAAVAFSYDAGKEIAQCRGAFVLLIDDVLTSGATVARCAELLKKNGADAVCALTPAYTISTNEQ